MLDFEGASCRFTLVVLGFLMILTYLEVVWFRESAFLA